MLEAVLPSHDDARERRALDAPRQQRAREAHGAPARDLVRAAVRPQRVAVERRAARRDALISGVVVGPPLAEQRDLGRF